jgi:hypothetical protein
MPVRLRRIRKLWPWGGQVSHQRDHSNRSTSPTCHTARWRTTVSNAVHNQSKASLTVTARAVLTRCRVAGRAISSASGLEARELTVALSEVTSTPTTHEHHIESQRNLETFRFCRRPSPHTSCRQRLFRHSVCCVQGNFWRRIATFLPRIHGTKNHPVNTTATAELGSGIRYLTTWTRSWRQLVATHVFSGERSVSEQCERSQYLPPTQQQALPYRIQDHKERLRQEKPFRSGAAAAGPYACGMGGKCRPIYQSSADRKRTSQLVETECNARGKRRPGRTRRS